MARTDDRAARKAEKAQTKADRKASKKAYERNHAQLKRQQSFHAVLLAAQVRRGRKQAKRNGAS